MNAYGPPITGDVPLGVVILIITLVSGFGYFINFFSYSVAGLDEQGTWMNSKWDTKKRRYALVIFTVPYLLAITIVIAAGVSFVLREWKRP